MQRGKKQLHLVKYQVNILTVESLSPRPIHELQKFWKKIRFEHTHKTCIDKYMHTVGRMYQTRLSQLV